MENWNVEFYKTENGNIPTLKFLLTLPPKIRAKEYLNLEQNLHQILTEYFTLLG